MKMTQLPIKELYFNAYDINTLMLNNTDQDIIICADSYENGQPVRLNLVFKDINFLEWISTHEIETIKANLKKRIDEL
jgi:hypothetical protein